MNQFITFRDKDENGEMQYYVLQRAFPHFVGRISPVPIEGALANEPVAGYNLYVTFNGTLVGNLIPNYRNIQAEISSVFLSMALWFHAERVLLDTSRFKKFKIKNDVDSPTEQLNS
jgi:hypothetical protein